jgi:hypothetical protein
MQGTLHPSSMMLLHKCGRSVIKRNLVLSTTVVSIKVTIFNVEVNSENMMELDNDYAGWY